jgi:hypothetical protein
MQDNMDINAGAIADGEKSVQDVGREIFDMLLRVASGEKTCAERLGHQEFVPWADRPGDYRVSNSKSCSKITCYDRLIFAERRSTTLGGVPDLNPNEFTETRADRAGCRIITDGLDPGARRPDQRYS